MDLELLRHNLLLVRARIAEATRRSGRGAGSVTFVAVTKRSPAEWIPALLELGARDLGENYPQELWRKADALSHLPARWHLIGHLQGNKARRTLPLVHMIHAVDSIKLLKSLDQLSLELGSSTSVCLQVNTSGETTKHGWEPAEILEQAESIAQCGQIQIVGLMTMAAFDTNAETARPSFARLRAVRNELRLRTGLTLEHLSMGMSNDFETAIEEGATLVRIGSALFEGLTP
jgi:pyridoxal phosphate enzyme (YggS family)